MSKTRQIIEIDVTWIGWRKLTLKSLLAWLVTTDMDIERITVREVKRKR